MPNHRIHAHSMNWASMDLEGIYGGRSAVFATRFFRQEEAEMTEIPPTTKRRLLRRRQSVCAATASSAFLFARIRFCGRSESNFPAARNAG